MCICLYLCIVTLWFFRRSYSVYSRMHSARRRAESSAYLASDSKFVLRKPLHVSLPLHISHTRYSIQVPRTFHLLCNRTYQPDICSLSRVILTTSGLKVQSLGAQLSTRDPEPSKVVYYIRYARTTVGGVVFHDPGPPGTNRTIRPL